MIYIFIQIPLSRLSYFRNNRKIYQHRCETFLKIKFPIQNRPSETISHSPVICNLMQQYNDSCFFGKNILVHGIGSAALRVQCASVTSRRSRLPERFMQRSSKRTFLLRFQVAQTVQVDNGTGPENVPGENVTISIFVADFSISVPRHDRQISSTGSSIFSFFSPGPFIDRPFLASP